jgi:hypothetical protein
LAVSQPSKPPVIDSSVPSSPRIWNFWMGGKDNYPVDKAVGEQGLAIDPDIGTMAKASRGFLIRAVAHLAREAGVRQFLDVGTGLPASENTHEVAQRIAPESRVVYVDNDPSVLRHAEALLQPVSGEGTVAYVDCDFHDPERIVEEARKTLDFGEPVAVMFMGVLGHARSYADMRRIVRTVTDAVPAGSYLILWDGTVDSKPYVALCEEYAKGSPDPYYPRTQAEISACFEGLEFVEPGFGKIADWRPDPAAEKRPEVAAYGGVARKP